MLHRLSFTTCRRATNSEERAVPKQFTEQQVHDAMQRIVVLVDAAHECEKDATRVDTVFLLVRAILLDAEFSGVTLVTSKRSLDDLPFEERAHFIVGWEQLGEPDPLQALREFAIEICERLSVETSPEDPDSSC